MLSQTLPLLLSLEHKSPSEITAASSGWAESSNIAAVCQSKKGKHLAFNSLLRVAYWSQLSYQSKSLHGPTGPSIASLSIGSASASNTGTEKLNHYSVKTLLPPTLIKKLTFWSSSLSRFKGVFLQQQKRLHSVAGIA